MRYKYKKNLVYQERFKLLLIDQQDGMMLPKTTQFIIVTQERTKYLRAPDYTCPMGLGKVEPRTTSCHINHINVNGIKRNGRTQGHFNFPHIKDGVLFFYYRRKGWNPYTGVILSNLNLKKDVNEMACSKEVKTSNSVNSSP